MATIFRCCYQRRIKTCQMKRMFSTGTFHACTITRPENYCRILLSIQQTTPMKYNLKMCECRTFQTSCSLNKKKDKKGGKKIEILVKPSEVEEYIDLKMIQNEMEGCLEILKQDYIKSFQIGNDIQSIEQFKIILDDDEFDLSEVAVINKQRQNLLLIDLTDFPEAVKPTVKAFGNQSMYSLQNPSGNDLVLKVAIPQITAEGRNKLAKDAKVRLNKTKDDLKQFLNISEKEMKTHEHVPEDALKIVRAQMQIFVKFYSHEAENIFKAKENDILLK